MFLLKGRNKSFYSSAGVIGNIRLSRVDRRRVLPLVSYPSVNNFLSLNERSFLSHRKLTLIHVLTLLVVAAAIPSVAFAQTDIGSYETRMAAVFGACGYDLSDYSGESGHTAASELAVYGSSYPDYTYFAHTFSNSSLDATYWSSSLDGFAYAFAKDAAKADIDKAIAKCADAKGGTFSGNTGSGGSGSGGTGSGSESVETNGGTGEAITWSDIQITNKHGEYKDADGEWRSMADATITLHVDEAVLSNLNSRIGSKRYYYPFAAYNDRNSSKWTCGVYLVDQDLQVTLTGDEPSRNNYVTRLRLSGGQGTISYYYEKTYYSRYPSSVVATANTVDIYLVGGQTLTQSTTDSSYVTVDNGHGLACGGLIAGSGGSGSGGSDTPTYTYPTDNPYYPSPTTPTAPDTSLPTIGEYTDTTVDLSPVTNRQDATNTMLYGIGSDLGNLYNMIWNEFDQLEAEVYDLGDYIGNGISTGVVMLGRINSNLSMIYDRMGDLDQDTDGIDLTGINMRLDDILAALGASDAYDDSGLISVITGSHGTDLLGLFGRIDLICNWLDAYTGFDDSDLVTLLGDIYGTLNNLQDPDSGFATIRGDVRALLNTLTGIDELLDGWPDYPSSLDLSTLEQYASDSLGELRDLASNFTSYWTDFDLRLDALLNAIKNLDFGTRYTPGGNPPRPTQTQIVQYVDWAEWDNAVETLMHKFPFVIVNDISMIFAAITRPPVTPVFDLPMPNPSDWSQPYLVHVDLSDWDTVAAVMRVGIIIWVISRVSRRTLALFTRDEGAAA